MALAGSLTLTYQLGAEMLNFGGFIAFMGVEPRGIHALLGAGGRQTAGRFHPGAAWVPDLSVLVAQSSHAGENRRRPLARSGGAVRRDQDARLPRRSRVVRGAMTREIRPLRALSGIRRDRLSVCRLVHSKPCVVAIAFDRELAAPNATHLGSIRL